MTGVPLRTWPGRCTGWNWSGPPSPVIEVTVITPPDGIPRLELDRAVAEKLREFAVPRRVLTAACGAREQIAAQLPESGVPRL